MPVTVTEEGEARFKWDPPCSELYNFFSMCRCMSCWRIVMMQFKWYHREGKFNDCQQFVDEWRACMKTKFMKTDEAQRSYEQYQFAKKSSRYSPVWQTRETPPDLFSTPV